MIRESREHGKGFAGRANLRVASGLGAPSRKGLDRAEERRLVAAARSGDARALERLLKAVSGTVYRYGKTFCRDPHDAEDTLQDVLVALVRSLETFRGEAALSTWAFTVARRTCMRRRRLGLRATSIESEAGRPALDVPDASASPVRDAERAELRRALEREIAALPDAQRDVLLLRDVEGRSAEQVARALKLGVRAVKSRLHRARLAVRRALEDPERARKAPPPTRECPDMVRLLNRYLEDELPPGLCTRLEAHVATCGACKIECDELRATIGGCHTWGGASIPAPEREQIRAAIRATVARLSTGVNARGLRGAARASAVEPRRPSA